MKATILPSCLRGNVAVVPSKSQAHRMLICAALADKPSQIVCAATSRDIEATVACLRALGAEIIYREGTFFVTPVKTVAAHGVLPCGESGSTLRFLLPVAAALGGGAKFLLEGRLPQRPVSPLWEELCSHGCSLSRPECDSILLQGSLVGNNFTIAADISSQFISGLLFALPLLGGGEITLTGKIESAGYLEMTCQVLRQFGVQVDWCDARVCVLPGGYHTPGKMRVEGDWSSAAFWLCARALGGDIECTGLNESSAQRDRLVIPAIKEIRRQNATISARDIPDLVPVLAVLAAATPGTTRFTDAQRLRIKESDRIASTLSLIEALGGSGKATKDGLEVYGKERLRGGVCNCFHDHRIAMSAAVASLVCQEPVIIPGAQAVEKSYPTFWKEFARLGGQVRLEEEA